MDPDPAFPGRLPAGSGGAGGHPAVPGQDLPDRSLLPVAAGPPAAHPACGPAGSQPEPSAPGSAHPGPVRRDRSPGACQRPGGTWGPRARRDGSPIAGSPIPCSGRGNQPACRFPLFPGPDLTHPVADRRGGQHGLVHPVLRPLPPDTARNQSAPSARGSAGSECLLSPGAAGPLVQPHRPHPHAGGVPASDDPAAPAALCGSGPGRGAAVHPPP